MGWIMGCVYGGWRRGCDNFDKIDYDTRTNV
jgi:hypothetical protein